MKVLSKTAGMSFLLLALASGPSAASSFTFRILSDSDEAVHSAVITAGDPVEKVDLAEAEMDQIDKEFSPFVLPVREGQAVAFPNRDNVRHHVYSFSPAKPFEIRLYSGRPGEPVEFDKPGVVVLGCNIHDNMVGYIYVTEKPYRASSDYSGTARLDTTSDIDEITLWHPNLSLDSQLELNLKIADLDTVQEEGQTVHIVELDIPTPDRDPQAIRSPANRFDRFRID